MSWVRACLSSSLLLVLIITFTLDHFYCLCLIITLHLNVCIEPLYNIAIDDIVGFIYCRARSKTISNIKNIHFQFTSWIISRWKALTRFQKVFSAKFPRFHIQANILYNLVFKIVSKNWKLTKSLLDSFVYLSDANLSKLLECHSIIVKKILTASWDWFLDS